MTGTRIHITETLEKLLRKEIADAKALPLLGATSESQYWAAQARLRALEWVLHLAHAELDDDE